MPYIGHNPTNAGSFALIDDISSTFNGSNVAFTLNVGGVNITPNVQNLLIAIDGVVQQAPDAYSVSGSTINFTGAPASGADFYGILMGNSSYVENNSIGADELIVSGDGSSGQVLTSDGDGTFSWATDAEDYLPLAGGTMSGAINLGSQNVTNGGTITGTFVGGITGNVTGNVSGTAPAGTLTGSTLASGVTASSLTSVGTLGSTSVSTSSAQTAFSVTSSQDASNKRGLAVTMGGSNAGMDFGIFVDAGSNVTSGSVIKGISRSASFTGDLLTLDCDSSASGAVLINAKDAGTSKFIVKADGKAFLSNNLVVGTTTYDASDYQFDQNLIVKGTTPALILDDTNGDGFLTIYTTGAHTISMYDHSGDYIIKQATNPGGSSAADILKLDSSKNATFAGTVSAGSTTGNAKLSQGNAVNAPPYQFVSDSGTGMYRVGNGQVGICGVDTLVATFDGNNSNTTFAGSAVFNNCAFSSAYSIRRQSNALILTGGTNGYYFNNDDNSLSDMHISAAGNVGIGNTAPDRRLVVEGNAASDYIASFRNEGNNANRYGLIIYAGADDGSGTTDYITCQDGDGTQVGYIRNTSGTFALTDVSDRRLKENIRDTEVKGLDAVSSMKVRDFEWKKSGETCIGGFIAQELESAFASAVTGEDDALEEDGKIKPMGVSRDVLVPVLVKAVQELSAKVTALENA